MTKQVSVSRPDVAAAQLVVRLNESQGPVTAPAIQEIADVTPAMTSDENSNGSSNGR